MTSIVAESRRHARDYWQIDGLPRIVSGLAAASLGGGLLLFDRHGWWGLLCLAILGYLGLRFEDGNDLVEWMKVKITYPRSGYVDSLGKTRTFETAAEAPVSKPRKGESRLRRITNSLGVFVLLGALASSWILAVVIGTPWICLMAGGLAGMFVFAMYQADKDNLAWVSMIGWLLIGFALAHWGLARHHRISFLFIAGGCLSATRGALTLLRFIRHHPLQQES